MATMPVRLVPGFPDIRDYPQSGNRTMPSTQHERAQRTVAMLLVEIVAPDDIVPVELMMLLDAKNWRRHLTPDVFLARGVGELDPIYGVPRRQYRIWDEGKVPELVYEGASPSTKDRDSAGKKDDYAALGVGECVQFDPLGELLFPRLKVHRLNAFGGYERMVPEDDGAVRCVTLPDYDWLIDGYLLRLRERATGRLVPTPGERAEMETARADAEAARADSAEAELVRLREQLAHFQSHPEPSL
jgi:Uma2 family endonuclease